jgi:hypothetical protein
MKQISQELLTALEKSSIAVSQASKSFENYGKALKEFENVNTFGGYPYYMSPPIETSELVKSVDKQQPEEIEKPKLPRRKIKF